MGQERWAGGVGGEERQEMRKARGFQCVWLGGGGHGGAMGPEEAKEGGTGLGRKAIRLESWPHVCPSSGLCLQLT